MSDEADWGPWVEHDGRGCPVVGSFVEAVFIMNQHGDLWVGSNWAAGGESWSWAVHRLPVSQWQRIVRYRVRRPKALRDLIALVETLPAPAPQPDRVDA